MTPHGNDGQRGGAAPALAPHDGYLASLLGLQQRGYCTDEWSRWQQGQCGTYAVALMQLRPRLRFGTLGITRAGGGDASSGWTPEHHFAHDGAYAYDSAGRHPLPYHGVYGDADYYELDADPDDWAPLSEEGSGDPDIVAAQEHALRHRILDGGYGPRPGPDQGAASGLITGPEFRGPSGLLDGSAHSRTTNSGRDFVTSPLGRQGWDADDAEHAVEQHRDAFPDEPVISVRAACDEPRKHAATPELGADFPIPVEPGARVRSAARPAAASQASLQPSRRTL